MADSLLSLDQIGDDNNALQESINKWKDKPQDELLKAKAESDVFIKTLTNRFDELRKDYLTLKEQNQTSTQLKEVLDRLEKERTAPAASNDNPDHQRDVSVQPSLKPEEIQNLINQEINKNKLLDKQTQNFNQVEAKLREHFGDNYHGAYKQRLDTLGMSPEFADDLARNHPTVFLKTMELDTPRRSADTAPPRTQQRPTSFAPQHVKRDYNYYQKLKAENPRLYLDPKIAVQMHNDIMELGSEFGLPED